MDISKMQRQAAFWQSMMGKYQERNCQLEEQQCQLQHRLEAMECSMPAALMYNMNRNAYPCQIDMLEFMSQLGRPKLVDECACAPCLAKPPPPIVQQPNLNCPCGSCMGKQQNGGDSCICNSPIQPSANFNCPCDSCMGQKAQQAQQQNIGNDSCICSPSINQQIPQPSVHSDSVGSCACNPCVDDQTSQQATTSGSVGSCACNPCVDDQTSQQAATLSSVGSCSCNPCIDDQTSQQATSGGSGCDPCADATSANSGSSKPNADNGSAGSCTCNPCADTSSLASCSCSPCPDSTNGQQNGSTGSCPCNPCTDSVGTGSYSQQPTGSIGSCPCDPCVASRQAPPPSPAANLCTCNPCLAQDGTGSNMMDKISLFSIQSADLQCMNRLHELANQEKQMKRQIQEMEHRENAYMNTLRQADDMWNCMGGGGSGGNQRRMSQSGDNSTSKYDKMSEKLMNENARLAGELNDLKSELRQCMQKVQGPLNRQLEEERRKSLQLEDELKFSCKAIANKDYSYVKDMNTLQTQLSCTCQNMTELSTTNEQLKRDMCMLECKYKQLQEDLINQKISEAHTIERFSDALCMQQAKGDSASRRASAEPEDNSLYAIARRLSKTLTNVNECTTCKKLPGDLTDTVKGIKDIVDIVDQGGSKKGGEKRSSQSKREPEPPSTPPEPEATETEGAVDQGTTTTVRSSLDVSIQGAGSVDVQTETEVIILQTESTKGPSLKSSKSGSRRSSRESAGSLSKHSSKVPSVPSSKSGSRSRSSRASLQDAAVECLCRAMQEFVESQTSVGVQQPEVEITTEVEVEGDVEVEIENQVNLYETVSDGINITTTITGSGTLEVITEGPAGVIETTMIYTESGNIEVTTEITEYPEEGYGPLALALPTAAIDEGYSRSDMTASVSSTSRITTSTSRLTPSSMSRMTPESSFISEKPSRMSEDRTTAGYSTSQETTVTERSRVSFSEAESDVSAVSKIVEESETDAEKSEAERSASERSVTDQSDVEAEGAEVAEVECDVECEAAQGEEAGEGVAVEGEAGQVEARESIAVEGEAGEVESVGGEAFEGEAAGDELAEAAAGEAAEAGETGEAGEAAEAAEGIAIEGEAAEGEAAAESEGAASGAEAGAEVEAEAEAVIAAEGDASKSATGICRDICSPSVAVSEVYVEAETPSEAQVPTEDEVFVEAPSTPIAVPEEADTFADAEAEAKTGAAADEGELEIRIEVTQEGEEEPIEIEARVDVEGEEAKPLRHESIDEEPFAVPGDDSDELRKGVERALMKANEDVMGALGQANKDVTDALEKANKDVENALALAVKETQSKANKQAATEEELLRHPSMAESVPRGSESKTVPLVASATRESTEGDVSEAPSVYEAALTASEATATVVTPAEPPKEGWDSLYGEKKPDMPRVKSVELCKDVCSPTYDKEKAVECLDICAKEFKENAPAETAPVEPVAKTEEIVSVTVEIGGDTTTESFASVPSEIPTSESMPSAVSEPPTTKSVSSAPSEATTLSARQSVELEKQRSKTESRASRGGSAGGSRTAIAKESPSITGKTSSITAKSTSRKSLEKVEEMPKVPSRKSSKAEDSKTKLASRKSSKIEEETPPAPRKSSAGSRKPSKTLSTEEQSRRDARRSSDRPSRSASKQLEGRKPADAKSPRLSKDRRSSDDKCKDVCAQTHAKQEDEDVCGKEAREKERGDDKATGTTKRSALELVSADKKSAPELISTSTSAYKPTSSASRIPVPVQRRSKLAEISCDCGQCECVICSPDIMRQRDERLKAARLAKGTSDDCTCMPGCTCAMCTEMTGANAAPVKPKKDESSMSMGCCDPKLEHPPDCDCLDCLCDPCATHPDHGTKPHPPDCDCVPCLCDPCSHDDEVCGSTPNSKPTSRPASAQLRPTSQQSSPTLPHSDASKASHEMPCREGSSLKDYLRSSREASARQILGSKEQQHLVQHPPNCDCLICRCCNCPGENVQAETPAESKHTFPPEECVCPECLCLQGISPTLKSGKVPLESLPEETDEEDNFLKMDDDALENRIEEMEKESLDRKKEMGELRDVIRQIQCSCYEAEVRASITPQQTSQQTPSYTDTVSGLQLALSSLQDKCKQKDRLIGSMVEELKLRANSKVFNDMLQRLAASESTDVTVDFDRTEICGSLPRPSCDPKYGNPSNQLKQPLICEPCEHPDFPNCPCKLRSRPTTPVKPKGCSHPNYPNCPCANDDQPPPPPSTCSHPDYPNCPCGAAETISQPGEAKTSPPNYPACGCEDEASKDSPRKSSLRTSVTEERRPSSQKSSPRTSIASEGKVFSQRSSPRTSIEKSDVCDHPNYPACGCEDEANTVSSQRSSLRTSVTEERRPSSQKSSPRTSITEECRPSSPRASEEQKIPSRPTSPRTSEESKIPSRPTSPRTSEEPKISSKPTSPRTSEESKIPSRPTSPRTSEEPKISSKPTSPRTSEESKIPSRPTSPRTSTTPSQPCTCATGSRSSSAKSGSRDMPCTIGSPTCRHSNYPNCPCTATSKLPVPQPQPLAPCPAPDGTCPCPKQPKQPSLASPKHDETCPCSRPGSAKKVSVTKEEPRTTTDDDSTSDQISSSLSDRKSSSSRSGRKSSSSRSGRRSSSQSRSEHRSSSERQGTSRSSRDSSSHSSRRKSSSGSEHNKCKSKKKPCYTSKRKSSHSSSSRRSSRRSDRRSSHASSRRNSRESLPHTSATVQPSAIEEASVSSSQRKNSQGKSSPSIPKCPTTEECARPASAVEKRMTAPTHTPSSETPISRSARLRRLSTTPRHSGLNICECDTHTEIGGFNNKPQPPPGEVVDSSPMEITEIRRISPDSLIIKWNAPISKYITGYEILVDGIIKSRVHSSRRTSAVLHTLILKESVHISIFAITSAGRCEPPANAVFQT